MERCLDYRTPYIKQQHWEEWPTKRVRQTFPPILGSLINLQSILFAIASFYRTVPMSRGQIDGINALEAILNGYTDASRRYLANCFRVQETRANNIVRVSRVQNAKPTFTSRSWKRDWRWPDNTRIRTTDDDIEITSKIDQRFSKGMLKGVELLPWRHVAVLHDVELSNRTGTLIHF